MGWSGVTSGDRLSQWENQIHQGDAAETLAQMPEGSVNCVMTSPPYYGLRDYGIDGQIGLEESLDDYIESLLDVADEVRRVLRDDGSWWLNLGDSFAGSWGAQSKDETENNLPQHDHPDKNPARHTDLRRKNKMLVPHRVAIALQEHGWIVRSDAVWSKPNPMPHPVKDRLHEHKEFVFHLTPEPDYWFDLDSIRIPHKKSSLERTESSFGSSAVGSLACPREDKRESVLMDAEDALHPNGKNPGDVFEIPVRAFPEAHFAVYPPELCEAPIKATCPEDGVVLDPFAGAGTTCLVAKRLSRRFVGIELNPDYVAMAQKRVGIDVDEPERLLEDDETTILEYTEVADD